MYYTPARLAFLFVCILSPAALAAGGRAAPAGPPPTWDITLGAGAALVPTFEGSDRYRVRPIPLFGVTWRDTISLGDGGLSAYWHHRNLRIGGGLTFDPGRKDHSSGGVFESGDDRLKGLAPSMPHWDFGASRHTGWGWPISMFRRPSSPAARMTACWSGSAHRSRCRSPAG